MAKLPPKLNLERLRAEVEKLLPVGERLRAELRPIGERFHADLAAERSPRKKAKRTRRAKRNQIEGVVNELWPRGVPARSPNRKLLILLRLELKRQHIRVSSDPTTLLRALGRRRDPKKKPMK